MPKYTLKLNVTEDLVVKAVARPKIVIDLPAQGNWSFLGNQKPYAGMPTITYKAFSPPENQTISSLTWVTSTGTIQLSPDNVVHTYAHVDQQGNTQTVSVVLNTAGDELSITPVPDSGVKFSAQYAEVIDTGNQPELDEFNLAALGEINEGDNIILPMISTLDPNREVLFVYDGGLLQPSSRPIPDAYSTMTALPGVTESGTGTDLVWTYNDNGTIIRVYPNAAPPRVEVDNIQSDTLSKLDSHVYMSFYYLTVEATSGVGIPDLGDIQVTATYTDSGSGDTISVSGATQIPHGTTVQVLTTENGYATMDGWTGITPAPANPENFTVQMVSDMKITPLAHIRSVFTIDASSFSDLDIREGWYQNGSDAWVLVDETTLETVGMEGIFGKKFRLKVSEANSGISVTIPLWSYDRDNVEVGLPLTVGLVDGQKDVYEFEAVHHTMIMNSGSIPYTSADQPTTAEGVSSTYDPDTDETTYNLEQNQWDVFEGEGKRIRYWVISAGGSTSRYPVNRQGEPTRPPNPSDISGEVAVVVDENTFVLKQANPLYEIGYELEVKPQLYHLDPNSDLTYTPSVTRDADSSVESLVTGTDFTMYADDVLEISAVDNPGSAGDYVLQGWTINGNESGSANPLTYPHTAYVRATAIPIVGTSSLGTVTLTVTVANASPTLVDSSSNPIPWDSEVSGTYIATVAAGTEITLDPGLPIEYYFTEDWQGHGGLFTSPATDIQTFVANGNVTVSRSNAIRTFEVNVNFPNGTYVVNDLNGNPIADTFNIPYGTFVKVALSFYQGYEFVEWDGSGPWDGSTDLQQQFEITALTNINVIDRPVTQTLSAKFGSGEGTVSVYDVDNGYTEITEDTPGSGTYTVNYGQTLQVVASTYSCYSFGSWNSNYFFGDDSNLDQTFIVSGDHYLYPTGNLDSHAVSISVDPNSTLTEIYDLDLNNGTTYNNYDLVPCGTNVRITVDPATGYEFGSWDQDVSPNSQTSNVIELQVTGQLDLTYTLSQSAQTLTLSGDHMKFTVSDTNGTVYGPSMNYGDGLVAIIPYGITASVSVEMEMDYEFDDWGDGYGNSLNRDIIMSQDQTVSAAPKLRVYLDSVYDSNMNISANRNSDGMLFSPDTYAHIGAGDYLTIVATDAMDGTDYYVSMWNASEGTFYTTGSLQARFDHQVLSSYDVTISTVSSNLSVDLDSGKDNILQIDHDVTQNWYANVTEDDILFMYMPQGGHFMGWMYNTSGASNTWQEIGNGTVSNVPHLGSNTSIRTVDDDRHIVAVPRSLIDTYASALVLDPDERALVTVTYTVPNVNGEFIDGGPYYEGRSITASTEGLTFDAGYILTGWVVDDGGNGATITAGGGSQDPTVTVTLGTANVTITGTTALTITKSDIFGADADYFIEYNPDGSPLYIGKPNVAFTYDYLTYNSDHESDYYYHGGLYYTDDVETNYAFNYSPFSVVDTPDLVPDDPSHNVQISRLSSGGSAVTFDEIKDNMTVTIKRTYFATIAPNPYYFYNEVDTNNKAQFVSGSTTDSNTSIIRYESASTPGLFNSTAGGRIILGESASKSLVMRITHAGGLDTLDLHNKIAWFRGADWGAAQNTRGTADVTITVNAGDNLDLAFETMPPDGWTETTGGFVIKSLDSHTDAYIIGDFSDQSTTATKYRVQDLPEIPLPGGGTFQVTQEYTGNVLKGYTDTYSGYRIPANARVEFTPTSTLTELDGAALNFGNERLDWILSSRQEVGSVSTLYQLRTGNYGHMSGTDGYNEDGLQRFSSLVTLIDVDMVQLVIPKRDHAISFDDTVLTASLLTNPILSTAQAGDDRYVPSYSNVTPLANGDPVTEGSWVKFDPISIVPTSADYWPGIDAGWVEAATEPSNPDYYFERDDVDAYPAAVLTYGNPILYGFYILTMGANTWDHDQQTVEEPPQPVVVQPSVTLEGQTFDWEIVESDGYTQTTAYSPNYGTYTNTIPQIDTSQGHQLRIYNITNNGSSYYVFTGWLDLAHDDPDKQNSDRVFSGTAIENIVGVTLYDVAYSSGGYEWSSIYYTWNTSNELEVTYTPNTDNYPSDRFLPRYVLVNGVSHDMDHTSPVVTAAPDNSGILDIQPKHIEYATVYVSLNEYATGMQFESQIQPTWSTDHWVYNSSTIDPGASFELIETTSSSYDSMLGIDITGTGANTATAVDFDAMGYLGAVTAGGSYELRPVSFSSGWKYDPNYHYNENGYEPLNTIQGGANTIDYYVKSLFQSSYTVLNGVASPITYSDMSVSTANGFTMNVSGALTHNLLWDVSTVSTYRVYQDALYVFYKNLYGDPANDDRYSFHGAIEWPGGSRADYAQSTSGWWRNYSSDLIELSDTITNPLQRHISIDAYNAIAIDHRSLHLAVKFNSEMGWLPLVLVKLLQSGKQFYDNNIQGSVFNNLDAALSQTFGQVKAQLEQVDPAPEPFQYPEGYRIAKELKALYDNETADIDFIYGFNPYTIQVNMVDLETFFNVSSSSRLSEIQVSHVSAGLGVTNTSFDGIDVDGDRHLTVNGAFQISIELT
jgi:hypothetical protein